MNNPALVWPLWAVSVTLTLIGVEVVDTYPDNSLKDLLGHVAIGFGLLAMLLTGRSMDD